MRARSVPLGTMFGWVPATFRLVTRHFGAWSLASVITLFVALLLALPMLVYLFMTMPALGSPGVPPPQDLTGLWIAYAIFIVTAMVLMPPLLAGWFRLCAAADRGEAISGTSVLSAYGDRGVWLRMIVFALIGMLVYFAVIGLLALLFGDAFAGLMAMQAAQDAALATGSPPPPPDMALLGKVLLMYVVALPLLVVLQLIYMAGLAEVSLRPTSAPGAFAEAAGGVLRNLLKLLLFLFCLWMGLSMVLLVVVLVVGVVIAGLMLLSPVAGMVVAGIAYVALLTFVYPLMFAGHYYLWKDMLGGEEPPALHA